MKKYHRCMSDAREQCVHHQPDSTGGDAGLAGASPVEAEPSQSRGLIVTPPAVYNDIDQIRFLANGVDTLDICLYIDCGQRGPRLLKRLGHLKAKAQRENGTVARLSPDREYLIYPGGKGKSPYSFHLECCEYHLFLSKKQRSNGSPNGYVSFSSKEIRLHGIDYLIAILQRDISALGGIITNIQVSRCDLAADFLIPKSITFDYLRERQVSKSRIIRPYFDDYTLETFFCGGKTAAIKMRIYDKGKEILTSGKDYYLDYWGVDSPENVWRVEFELHREFLRDFGVNSIEDLKQRIRPMWLYLTTTWFHLCKPEDRLAIDIFWQDVQECFADYDADCEAKRVYRNTTPASGSWYLNHIAGCLPGFAARHGYSERKQAIEGLCDTLTRKTEDPGFADKVRKLVIKLGVERKDGDT